MSVISDLARLRHELEAIPIELGDDRYKEIILEARVQQGLGIVTIQNNIGRHKVTLADKRTVDILKMRDNIGTIVDLQVIKIPKDIPQDIFKSANRILINGFKFVLRAINDEHSITYKVIVDRVQDNV